MYPRGHQAAAYDIAEIEAAVLRRKREEKELIKKLLDSEFKKRLQAELENSDWLKQNNANSRDFDAKKIHYLGIYHKYWIDKDERLKNPAFDSYSENILGLKRGNIASIKYFYNFLIKIFYPGLTLGT